MFCIFDGNYSHVKSALILWDGGVYVKSKIPRMLIDFSLDEAVERSELSVEAANFVSQHACTFSVELGVVRANPAASTLAQTLLQLLPWLHSPNTFQNSCYSMKQERRTCRHPKRRLLKLLQPMVKVVAIAVHARCQQSVVRYHILPQSQNK